MTWGDSVAPFRRALEKNKEFRARIAQLKSERAELDKALTVEMRTSNELKADRDNWQSLYNVTMGNLLDANDQRKQAQVRIAELEAERDTLKVQRAEYRQRAEQAEAQVVALHAKVRYLCNIEGPEGDTWWKAFEDFDLPAAAQALLDERDRLRGWQREAVPFLQFAAKKINQGPGGCVDRAAPIKRLLDQAREALNG